MDWMCIWGEKKGEWKQGESICCSNLEILNLFVYLIGFPLTDTGVGVGGGGVGVGVQKSWGGFVGFTGYTKQTQMDVLGERSWSVRTRWQVQEQKLIFRQRHQSDSLVIEVYVHLHVSVWVYVYTLKHFLRHVMDCDCGLTQGHRTHTCLFLA